MSDAVDKALSAIDHRQRTLDFAQSLGCTYEQAKVFADSQRDKFKWNGAVLSWGATGAPAADKVEKIKAHMRENGLSFLLPPADPIKDQINADPALLQSAVDGNLTAKGKLLRDTFKGDLPALERALAAKRENRAANKGNGADHANNPWSAKGWNVTRQGQLTRAAGEKKAAEMAAAVGCKLGATRPNPAYA